MDLQSNRFKSGAKRLIDKHGKTRVYKSIGSETYNHETQTVETPTSTIQVKVVEKYSIDWKDVGQGLILAIGTPVAVMLQQSIEAGNWTFNWKVIGMAAVGGGLTYLIKNFFKRTATIVTETKK